MKTSESLKNLAAALSKAQGAFSEPKKTKQAYNYKYAPMEECRKATVKSLTANGFSVIQLPVTNEGRAGVSTMLLHASGEFITGEYLIDAKQSPQDLGSLITYLRRYAYMAVLGLAPEDDDGLAAMPNKTSIAQKPVAKNKVEQPAPVTHSNPGDCSYDLTPRSPHTGKLYKEVPLQQLKKDLLYWNSQELSGKQKAKVDIANAYVATVS